jgi:hypothetical protein
MLRPSQPKERGGRTSFTNAGGGAVDARGVGTRGEGQGGRRIEPNPVSPKAACDERRCVRTAKPCGPGRRCYGQAERRCSEPNRARCIVNSRGEGGQKEDRLPGDHGISRQATAQGRPGCLGCPVCRCALSSRNCAQRTAGASRRPAFPAPFPNKGRRKKRKTRARPRREAAQACLEMNQRRRLRAERHVPMEDAEPVRLRRGFGGTICATRKSEGRDAVSPRRRRCAVGSARMTQKNRVPTIV